MSDSLTIDDLKYHELRQIISYMSVRQLFVCRRVCHKWNEIITELLDSNPVLSLHYNDINHYTKEELSRKCSNSRHLAVNASVGRLQGRTNAFVAAFTMASFDKIRSKLFDLFEFCPKVQSLDLCEFKVKLSDLDAIFEHCPLLQCLSITSDETDWTKFLSQQILGLKHFSLSLASKTPIYGVYERPLEEDFDLNCQLEELFIDRPQLNEMNLDILKSFLRRAKNRLKKFHLTPSYYMNEEQSTEIITTLSSNENSNSVIKDLNLNTNVFDGLYEALNTFSSLETLCLHLSNQTQHNLNWENLNLKSLKKIVLDFNANRSAFSMDSRHSESDTQLISVLSKLDSTLPALTLFDAVISSSLFSQIPNYFPNLQELELTYVYFEKDWEQSFWQIISNWKSLRKLTLNTTDVTDEGLEHIISCESLQSLELVKYKGPSAVHTYIDTYKVLQFFGQMASLKSNRWFDLRLDIDVCELSDQLKEQMPRNVRIVNVGHKK